MFDYKEIERTITDNNLPFQKIEDADKEILIQSLYDTFVFGNPRALWLNFKYVPYSILQHGRSLLSSTGYNRQKYRSLFLY